MLIHDASDPYHSVEVRGSVSMTTVARSSSAGCRGFTPAACSGDEGTSNVRAVAWVTPSRVIPR